MATPGAHSCNAPSQSQIHPKSARTNRANQFAKCNGPAPTNIEKIIVSALLPWNTPTSNVTGQRKRRKALPIEQENDPVPQQVNAHPSESHDPDSDEPPGPREYGALSSFRNSRHWRLAQLTLFGCLWLHENLPWPRLVQQRRPLRQTTARASRAGSIPG